MFMYPTPEPRTRPRWWHILHSWAVVAIAPASLGMLTFGAFWYAAAQMKSWVMSLCAAGYTAATVLEFVWIGPSDGEPEPTFGWLIAVTLIVGTGHLLAIRGRLARALAAGSSSDRERLSHQTQFELPSSEWTDTPAPSIGWMPPQPWATTPLPTPAALEHDPVYRQAISQRRRREQARALVAKNPQLAAELGIGRPDLGRGFDDGGLIDINEVSAVVLATLPGFDTELAEGVISARQRVGGRFFTAEDLLVIADVPSDVFERVRERLLVRPA